MIVYNKQPKNKYNFSLAQESKGNNSSPDTFDLI